VSTTGVPKPALPDALTHQLLLSLISFSPLLAHLPCLLCLSSCLCPALQNVLNPKWCAEYSNPRPNGPPAYASPSPAPST
jgi:hypothetical protein